MDHGAAEARLDRGAGTPPARGGWRLPSPRRSRRGPGRARAPKRRRRRGSQSDRAKKPSPPWLSTSATHAARTPGSSKKRSASEVRGAERRSGAPSGRLLAEEVAVAVAEEGLVEGVVAATGAGGHEAGELGPRVHARVEQGVALEVEEARPGEGLDLLPGEQRPLAVSPAGGRPRRRPGPPGRRPRSAPRPRAGGDAAGHEEDDGLHAVLPEQRRRHAPDGAPPVVEGQDDGAVGGLPLLPDHGGVLVRGEGDVAVLGEVLEAAREGRRARPRGTRRRGRRPRGSGPPVTNGGIAAQEQVPRHLPRLARAAAELAQRHLSPSRRRGARRRRPASGRRTRARRSRARRRGPGGRGARAAPRPRGRARAPPARAGGVGGRHEHGRHPVLEHLEAPVDRGRDDGAPRGHRLEEGERRALVEGGDAEDVEGAQQVGNVGAVPGEDDAARRCRAPPPAARSSAIRSPSPAIRTRARANAGRSVPRPRAGSGGPSGR